MFLIYFSTFDEVTKRLEFKQSKTLETPTAKYSQSSPSTVVPDPIFNNDLDATDAEPWVKQDYIVECDLQQVTDYAGLTNSEIFATFASSTSVDKQLAYAFFSDVSEQDTRLDKLLSFNQTFPGNPLALEQLLGLCTEVNSHEGCNQQLVEQAISAGGDNGVIWFAIANFYASRNATELVKNALRQVNTSPLFEESFADYIRLYVDSLQGRPNENFTQNALSAFGAAAAQPSFFNIISKLCTEKPKQDVEYLQICLSLGETMEQQGKTNLTQNIGMAYQEVIYDLEGNDLALNELEIRRTQNFENSAALFRKATNLALFDQRLFRSWLDNLSHLGEQDAASLLVEDAIALSQNPYYKPCL
ncbi:MAG: hypothetical protein ABJV04_09645 [Aliiglaciecola sp.]|uniref:hypothetical protein n=1 Tax=Aliiglaciecola sp. TaxID=1872441 RepID=UPI003298DE6F